MTALLPVDRWLEFLDGEYFGGYLRHGGSAVKFAIAPDGAAAPMIARQVRDLAVRRGHAPLFVDASTTKVHQVDRLFFECASQIPWDRLTNFVLEKMAVGEGFVYPPGLSEHANVASAVAEASGVDATFVRLALMKRIVADVFKNRLMSHDFRLAMSWLCQGRISASPTSREDDRLIHEWLTGRVGRIAALKHLSIFTKINRTNARLHLESLFHWIRFARIPGVVLVLNVQRLLDSGPVADGERYTRAALLDAYETLRQFIDTIDELEGLLLVVVADERILDPDVKQRGFGTYHALRNRVFDEVRDRTHANPASSLVRLELNGAA
jgi:hypothetical protein